MAIVPSNNQKALLHEVNGFLDKDNIDPNFIEDLKKEIMEKVEELIAE